MFHSGIHIAFAQLKTATKDGKTYGAVPSALYSDCGPQRNPEKSSRVERNVSSTRASQFGFNCLFLPLDLWHLRAEHGYNVNAATDVRGLHRQLDES